MKKQKKKKKKATERKEDEFLHLRNSLYKSKAVTALRPPEYFARMLLPNI